MAVLSSGRLDYDGVSFVFGEGTPFPITAFKRGGSSFREGDLERPFGDGRYVGVDRKGAPTHALSLALLGEGVSQGEREASARELASRVAVVWNAPSVRGRVGAVAELTVGERSAIGRPREYAPNDDGLWDGTGEAALQFAAVDDHWYGPEQVTRVQFVPETTGGLPVPADVPFVLGGGTGQADQIVQLGGDVAAFPVFELHGPIVDPWIDVPGVGRLVFTVTLAYDQVLTVDTRPWRQVVRRDGNPIHGAVSAAGSRMSEMGMPPGSYRVIFGGYDPSGNSWLDVWVRPAYLSL